MKSLQASPALHQMQHRCLFSLASRSGSNIADGATPCAATVCRLVFRYPVAVRIRCAFLVEREIHTAPIRAPAFCSIRKLASPGLVHLPNSKSCANLARRYPVPNQRPFPEVISTTVLRRWIHEFLLLSLLVQRFLCHGPITGCRLFHARCVVGILVEMHLEHI